MNKIKKLCDKYYALNHRRLGKLMGYHRDTIQKVSAGRRKMTPRFKTLLDGIERGLNNHTIKIPD